MRIRLDPSEQTKNPQTNKQTIKHQQQQKTKLNKQKSLKKQPKKKITATSSLDLSLDIQV